MDNQDDAIPKSHAQRARNERRGGISANIAAAAVLLGGAVMTSCGDKTVPNPPTPTWSEKPDAEKLSDIHKALDNFEKGITGFQIPGEDMSAWKAALPNFKIIKDALDAKDYKLAFQAFKLDGMQSYKKDWEAAARSSEAEFYQNKKSYEDDPNGKKVEAAEATFQKYSIELNNTVIKVMEARILQGIAISAMIREMAASQARAQDGR
jgi:hypothetical protein